MCRDRERERRPHCARPPAGADARTLMVSERKKNIVQTAAVYGSRQARGVAAP